MITAYKVVVSNILCELGSFCRHSAWAYTYTPEEWMKAEPGSGLFVFATQDQAVKFARASWSRSQVWECECEGPMTTPPMILGVLDSNIYIQRFWSNYTLGKSQPPLPDLINPPAGTLLFRRIKLIKRLRGGVR